MKIPVFIFILFFHCIFINSQVIFSENFETEATRDQWDVDEYVSGTVNWRFENGGYVNYPPDPVSGNYNALFQREGVACEATKLVSPSIDLATIQHYKLELRFWHAQVYWHGTDELTVFYKTGISNPWVELATYTEEIFDWEQHILLLPDSLYTDDFYIAFEGKTHWGYGVCIDSVEIVETGIINRYVDKVNVYQSVTNFVATGLKNNVILQLEILVQGNHNELILDSLAVKSLNTNDQDIFENGVKLYYTTTNEFSKGQPLGTGVNFNSAIATFTNLDLNLPTGYSYIWITYDIDSLAIQGNYVDAQISANSIKINSNTYPANNQSPSGKRIIYKTVFFDDFETDKGWILKPEFERAVPLGMGGELNGSPDPEVAVSGDYIIGTDITIDGDYELGLGDTAYYAISPLIDCYHYKDIRFSFMRWLNIDWSATAAISLSNTGGVSWIPIWVNIDEDFFITDNKWKQQDFNINTQFGRKRMSKIMFSLGNTELSYDAYSGWNIDDFIITGDFISKDVGISKWINPIDGCNLSDNEQVIIEVTNYGGQDSPDTIPVYYSFDNGETRYYDTIYESIPFDSSIIFSFTSNYDFSEGGFFSVSAGTLLSSDEDNSNNKKDTSLAIIPKYNLPYFQNFEQGTLFWMAHGTSNTWELGNPAGSYINSAASGIKAWVTNLIGYYNEDEYSYVESPRFDFSGIEHPIFEFKTFRRIDTTDGAWLMYSIDGGSDWNRVSNFGEPFDDWWNWYTDTSVAGTSYDGWTDTTSQWITSKKLLPDAMANQSCVRFRVMFKSDSVNNAEGFAFDDIKIYEAPPDIGVISIFSPVSACELSEAGNVSIRIKNFGLDTLNTGYQFGAGLEVNNNLIKIDTIILSSELLPGDSIEYIFSKTVDFGHSGLYQIKSYTILTQDINFMIR